MLAEFWYNIIQNDQNTGRANIRIPEKQSLIGFEEKKEHGDRDFPFTIYPCSIPVDFARVPVHWHEEMEIIAVKKGRGIVTVDRKRYEVGEGEFLFVFP